MRYSPKIMSVAIGVSFLALGAAVAQTPTPAQQQAIRSNCVSDYRAHCSSVPTGGMDALICLEQNVGSLSPACKSAVEAVEPATATTTPAATTDTDKDKATSTEGGTTKAPTATAPATTTAPASEPRLTFRQEMAIAAGSCATDFRLFCPNLPVGHGNVLFCLQVHANRLGTPCRDALTKLGVDLR